MANHLTEAMRNTEILLQIMTRLVETPQLLLSCHQLSPRNYFRLWKKACEQGCTQVSNLLQRGHLNHLNARESMNELMIVRQAAMDILCSTSSSNGVPRTLRERANDYAARYGEANEPLSTVDELVRAASKVLCFISPTL